MPNSAQQQAREYFNLAETATKKQISSAIKRRMLKCHPDKQAGKSNDDVQQVAKEFDQLKQWFDALKAQIDQQQAYRSADESQVHAANRKFSMAALFEMLERLSGGKGKLQALDESKTNQEVANPDSALVCKSNQLNTISGKYEYTRSYEDRPSVSVTLDLTRKKAGVHVNYNSEDSIRAGVEVMKGLGSSVVMMPDTLSKQQQQRVRDICKQEGVKCSTYSPNPKPKPKSNKTDALDDQERKKAITDKTPATADRQQGLANTRAGVGDEKPQVGCSVK